MQFLSYLINGISLGSVYALIALGYTMVYGIAKMLNFAHGDVIMIGSYVIFFAFGASFELPVALVIAALMGWVTPDQLKESRGYAVVGIFIIAAVITPPDVVSQLMLAIPMCALYEVGILAARWLVPQPPGESSTKPPA